MKGCPTGRSGSPPGLDGSTRLASSGSVGSRHPIRPPFPLEWQLHWAEAQVNSAATGDRSQTSPVSLSRTASSWNSCSTLNRLGLLICSLQLEKARDHALAGEGEPPTAVAATARPTSNTMRRYMAFLLGHPSARYGFVERRCNARAMSGPCDRAWKMRVNREGPVRRGVGDPVL